MKRILSLITLLLYIVALPAEHTPHSLGLCCKALEYFQSADKYGMLTHSGDQRMEQLLKLLGE